MFIQCGQKNYTVVLRSAAQPLFTDISRVIVNVFSRDIHHTRRLPRRSHDGTNVFNGGTTRLLLSLNAAGINKGKESHSTSMDPSVQCT